MTDSLVDHGFDSIVHMCRLGCGGSLLFFLRIRENLKQCAETNSWLVCLDVSPHLRLTTFAKGKLQEKCEVSLWSEKVLPKSVALEKK